MALPITAHFLCTKVETLPDGRARVTLQARTDGSNSEWAAAVPAGTLALVLNAAHAADFTQGSNYTTGDIAAE